MTAAGIMQAHVCGPLGQALAVIGGETWLYEAAGDRRRPTHNDIRFFFDHGLEVRPITGAGGSRVDISDLPAILDKETRYFRALHGVLFGMDPELDDSTRTRSMRRAATLLTDPAVDDFVSRRFLRPPDEGAWDVAHALELARSAELPVVVRLYAVINGPLLRRIEDTVREWAGVEGFDAVRRTDLVARTYDNGLVAAAAVAAQDGDRTRLGNLLFRADGARWDRRLVGHLAKVLMPPTATLPTPGAEKDDVVPDSTDPETTARSQVQAALDAYHARVRRQGRRRRGAEVGRRGAGDPLEVARDQIDWIAARFLSGHPGEAWNAVAGLARQQLATGEPAHLAMSLTSLATRLGPRTQPALALCDLAALCAPDDPAVRNARAEVLRTAGRADEALAAYQQTARDFPQNAVARNGRAETLRELGRADEALAAYQQTARDFPQDAVARNGLAETLRELGRTDEALVAYQQTAHNFPQNAYARTGLAETLRELGRTDEALAAYQQTARDFPQNAVARNGHATILVELDQPEAARAELRNVSQPPVSHADWIATHILCMIELRAGAGLALVSDLERFVQTCPYVKQQRYFRTSLAVARLALKQTGPARASLSSLAAEPGLIGIELAAINLMKAHAEALDGDLQAASRSLDTASNVFPYQEFRVRRMRQEMQRRFGLGGVPRLTVPTQIAAADQTLALLEMDFLANRASRSGPQHQKAA
jgi:tetratricopeptide (TPR) repeat protein